MSVQQLCGHLCCHGLSSFSFMFWKENVLKKYLNIPLKPPSPPPSSIYSIKKAACVSLDIPSYIRYMCSCSCVCSLSEWRCAAGWRTFDDTHRHKECRQLCSRCSVQSRLNPIYCLYGWWTPGPVSSNTADQWTRWPCLLGYWSIKVMTALFTDN